MVGCGHIDHDRIRRYLPENGIGKIIRFGNRFTWNWSICSSFWYHRLRFHSRITKQKEKADCMSPLWGSDRRIEKSNDHPGGKRNHVPNPRIRSQSHRNPQPRRREIERAGPPARGGLLFPGRARTAGGLGRAGQDRGGDLGIWLQPALPHDRGGRSHPDLPSRGGRAAGGGLYGRGHRPGRSKRSAPAAAAGCCIPKSPPGTRSS